MKVARFHPVRPVQTISELFGTTGSGPSGQVLTATGSNSSSVAWGSNVATITSNGSNVLVGPYVGLQSGTGIAFAASSNILTISSTSGGGGGASVSYGSNATRVSEVSSAGVATTVSSSDHIHDGIGTITASSSNTMQRGTWNLRAGSGIALSLTDTDGDGEFDTTTIVNTGQGGGGGGSGVTHAYVGYNTIGGSTESIVTRRQYMKKVTLAADCLLVGVGAYIKQTTANEVMTMAGGVLTDNAGSPELVIATSSSDTTSNAGFYATNTGSAGAARWLHVPVNVFLVAGDYWIAVEFELNSAGSHQVYFDSGSDRYFTNNALRITDSGWTAVTTSSNKYSIRASTIR